MPKILGKGGKPVAGASHLDKAHELIQKARAALEAEQQGYYRATVVADNGVEKSSARMEYGMTVRLPSGASVKAYVPAAFLTKKGKLSFPEMGRPGSTVVISTSSSVHERAQNERGFTIMRTVVETDFIVEAVL